MCVFRLRRISVAAFPIAMISRVCPFASSRHAFAAFAALLLTVQARAQEPARDPTSAPDSVADTLRAQIADLHAVGVRALVVGSGADAGVALLDVHAAGDPAHPALVRAGSAVTVDLGGIPVRLEVESVDATGVRIKAPTLRDGVLIPGAVRPAPEPSAPPSGPYLRHIEADGVPLDALLRLVADQTGANFAASEKAAAAPVSIALRNVAPEQFVAEICRARNLWFRRDAETGILRITTMEEYESSLSSLREQVSECFELRHPNVFEAASVLYGLYPDRIFLSLGSDELLDADLDDIGRRVDRFNALGGNSSALLDTSPGSVSSTRGGRSSGDGFLGVRTEADDLRRVLDGASAAPRGLTPEEAALIQKASSSGDAAGAERLLRAHSAAAGIFLTVSRRANLLLVRTSDVEAMDDIREVIRRIDVPTPMVLLEMKILNISVGDGYDSVFHTSFSDSSDHGAVKSAAAAFPTDISFDTASMADRMNITLLGRRFAAQLQWLETEGRVSVVDSPTLLVANNEVSRIFRGQRRPLVRNMSSSTTTSENGIRYKDYTTEIEWHDIGTMILVTPNINADRSVTLRLSHEESAVSTEKAHIPMSTSGSEGTNSLEYADLDILDSRSVSGTFVVQDGVPVAIGGLITETSSRVVKRVPFLGRIPLLGWFFRSTELVKNRNELVLLIKPHVIGDPSEGRAVSRRVLDNISKAQDVIDAQRADEDAEHRLDATFRLPPAPQDIKFGAPADLRD